MAASEAVVHRLLELEPGRARPRNMMSLLSAAGTKGRIEMSTTMWCRTAIACAALFGSALTGSAQTAATPADAA